MVVVAVVGVDGVVAVTLYVDGSFHPRIDYVVLLVVLSRSMVDSGVWLSTERSCCSYEDVVVGLLVVVDA